MSEYNIQMNKYNALNAEYDQLYPQPMKHASTHAKDGDDPITPSSIGAAELGVDGKVLASQVDAYSKEESISASTRTALSLAETATPDDAFSEIARQLSESGGIRMKILWENAAPNSSFAAHTISLQENDCTHFAVIFKNVINLTSPVFLVQPGDKANCAVVGSNGSSFQTGSTVIFTRYITEITQTTMTFTDAKTESNGTWQSYNNNIVPIIIYGVEGIPV